MMEDLAPVGSRPRPAARADGPPMAPKRPPGEVMRLARMGAFHPSRLSFMRVLLRRLRREGWRVDRPVWRIDGAGVGVATYRARGPERSYTLVAFAHDLPDEKRSDRVIADAWDATFTLVDGEPTEADLARLAANVPLQEAGRIGERELVLSRANRSVRLFASVVDRLARGLQPDPAEVDAVGYLMRTTAVYGAGKFGAADRARWAGRPEFAGAFQPEMLAVWLIRAFTLDLVEHLARARAPATAVAIEPALRRRFGVGNSTGLGMAPFLMAHPRLIHAWVDARETALARVRALPEAPAETRRAFRALVGRAAANAGGWRVEDPLQTARIEGLRDDLRRLAAHLDAGALEGPEPWDRLHDWAAGALTLEGQEQTVSLMLEPHGDLVDDLAERMEAVEDTPFRIDGGMSLDALGRLIERDYAWALATDFADPAQCARVWYVSEEKLEPRLGERFEEPLEPYEQPLAPGRDVAALHAALRGADPAETVARFLMRAPEHRHSVRRVQLAATFPYAEIRDNTIAAGMRPIDLLRCKLAFFGATRFDPRSDRWVRITMYRDAPFPGELAEIDPDDAAYPRAEAV
jgi:hypothetical protein